MDGFLAIKDYCEKWNVDYADASRVRQIYRAAASGRIERMQIGNSSKRRYAFYGAPPWLWEKLVREIAERKFPKGTWGISGGEVHALTGPGKANLVALPINKTWAETSAAIHALEQAAA